VGEEKKKEYEKGQNFTGLSTQIFGR